MTPSTFPDHFFKAPSSFGGGDPEVEAPPPPSPIPKTLAIASTIAEIFIEKTVSIDMDVMPCSWNKVPIYYAKIYLYQRHFQ